MPRENQQHRESAVQPLEFAFMAANDWLEFTCEMYDTLDRIDAHGGRLDAGVLSMSDGRTIPLLALAQHCHLRPREEWSDLISGHLRAMIGRLRDVCVDEPDVPLSLFDLRVRLVPDDPVDHKVFGELGARPYATGITQALAVDVVGGIRFVAEKELDDLGHDAHQVWAGAWAQTEALEQPDDVNVIDVGGADVVHVFGERPLTASLVGTVDQLLGPFPADGAIVSVPAGHSVLVHPLEGPAEARLAIDALIPITRQLFRQGPDSISAHLYWWRDGRLEWIPTYFARDGIEAYLPADLADLLQR